MLTRVRRVKGWQLMSRFYIKVLPSLLSSLPFHSTTAHALRTKQRAAAAARSFHPLHRRLLPLSLPFHHELNWLLRFVLRHRRLTPPVSQYEPQQSIQLTVPKKKGKEKRRRGRYWDERAAGAAAATYVRRISCSLGHQSVGSCTVERGRGAEARKHHVDCVLVQDAIAMTVPKGWGVPVTVGLCFNIWPHRLGANFST